MKKMLIALLLGVSLVGCGNQRDVNSIAVDDFPNNFYFIERDYNKEEVLELIKKDIEKAENIYPSFTSLIRSDNYIIIYEIIEVVGEDYEVWIHDILYGDEEYINWNYEDVKEVYEDVFVNKEGSEN